MRAIINGKEVEIKDNTKLVDIYKEYDETAFVAKINGELKDLNTTLKPNDKVQLLNFKDDEGKKVFWHSSAHLLAQALLSIFPDAKPTIGPAIDNGFYYDFDVKPLTPDDLKAIEKKMKELIHEKIPIVREEISKLEALKLFKNNPYKIELINDLQDGTITIYKQGNFIDLCRGPHVPNTSYIRAVKLMKVSGAYWRGDSNNKQLQRIYGISFPTKEELKDYLHQLEEAEKRDHRKIGKEMDLFSFHEEGPGFPFLHPNGMTIFNELVNYWREIHRKDGYYEVRTPIILSKELWVRSGHWDHYKNNMYFTKIDGRDFAIKPMNCPGGILIYKSKIRSYKDFPLKIGEIGLVHRHELSGVLYGLFRVREFTQDDAHIFIEEHQIEDAILGVIKLVDTVYKKFGFEYKVELSTRPDDFMGSVELWNKAEESLKKALKKAGLDFKINEGDGAFYGPKIDFHIKDCIGRTWQCATIQLDFQMPERFDLTYEGKDGKKHRPVMLHRVIYGSIERFMGILIEHFAGKLPLWLAPVQVNIMTVTDRSKEYAEEIKNLLFNNGLRVEIDDRSESISKKVRDAQLKRIPIIITIGDKEVESKTLAIRTLDGKIKFNVKPEELLEKILKNVKDRELKFKL